MTLWFNPLEAEPEIKIWVQFRGVGDTNTGAEKEYKEGKAAD